MNRRTYWNWRSFFWVTLKFNFNMESTDIRWKQRLQNFTKALDQMKKFMVDFENLNELEEQGLIKSFEYNFELAWNVIKDFYEFQGDTSIQGSRDAFRLAFKRGLIQDGDTWMSMIESRVLTVHTYDEKTAEETLHKIGNKYFDLFLRLHHELTRISNKHS